MLTALFVGSPQTGRWLEAEDRGEISPNREVRCEEGTPVLTFLRSPREARPTCPGICFIHYLHARDKVTIESIKECT